MKAKTDKKKIQIKLNKIDDNKTPYIVAEIKYKIKISISTQHFPIFDNFYFVAYDPSTIFVM